MSVSFYGEGIIKFKKLSKEEFDEVSDKLKNQLQPQHELHVEENGLYQFALYQRWSILEKCEETLNSILDKIDSAEINFYCDDEDGNIENPIPVKVNFEVCGGKLFRQELLTRLPCTWVYNTGDTEWFRWIDQMETGEINPIE